MDKYIGRLLDGRYEILEEIGRGGMAVVYRARCHRLNRFVAVKILKDDLSRDEDFRRRFHAESQAVAMLSHPNIVAVYDVNRSNESDYIVMELIDGLTLKQYMQQRGALSWREAMHFATQIAKALEHAHGRGIVHRDIKPHNIMILKDGSVKVADFGIARLSSTQNTLTREALGSVHYISPEQAKGAQVDARSDLYSLGVVVYEMLTGNPPYDGESPVAIAIQHINAAPVPPRQINPQIPLGLQQITLHAMCSELGARYNSATAMIEDLEALRKNPQIVFRFNVGPGGSTAYVDPRTIAAGNAAAGGTQQAVANAGSVQQTAGAQQRQRTTDPQQAARQKARTMAEMSVQRANQEKQSGRKKTSYVEPDYYDDDDDDRRGSKTPIIIVSILLVLVIALGIVLWRVFVAPPEETYLSVPSFLGMRLEDVLDNEYYSEFDLVEGDWVYSEEYEQGEVCGQSIKKGDSVPAGTTIRLDVSLGVESQAMPQLVGRSSRDVDSVMAPLIDALSIGIVYSYEESEDVEDGHVISTDPVEGTMLTVGQTVSIKISTGQGQKMTEVPEVIGLEEEDAIDALERANLKAEVTHVENSAEKGLVFYQSYRPDTEAPEGTVVGIKVSLGEAEPSPSPSPSQSPSPSPSPTKAPEPTREPQVTVQPSPSVAPVSPSPSTAPVEPSPSTAPVEPSPSTAPAEPSPSTAPVEPVIPSVAPVVPDLPTTDTP